MRTEAIVGDAIAAVASPLVPAAMLMLPVFCAMVLPDISPFEVFLAPVTVRLALVFRAASLEVMLIPFLAVVHFVSVRVLFPGGASVFFFMLVLMMLLGITMLVVMVMLCSRRSCSQSYA
jgi:hypothetical protein